MDTQIGVPHVEIYTDGGCEPNPGPGGYGVVLVHPKKRVEAIGGFRLTANNRMEMLDAGHQAEAAQETESRLLLRILSLVSKVPGHLRS
ncbi:MAG: hypothetical protein HY735_14760 [Verrucomicrobia bacterium]|nr:hypothetical protein [Verrucomicrobiota bacterium]